MELLNTTLLDIEGGPVHIYLNRRTSKEEPLEPRLRRIYTIETSLYKMMSELVDDDHAQSLLELADKDKPARGSKNLYATRLETISGEYEGEIRAGIRHLLKPHWDLILWANTKHFPPAITHEIERLTSELKKTQWLFGVFISYSSKDEQDVQQFVDCASEQIETRHLYFWKYTHEIDGGDHYESETVDSLSATDLRVIFVSPTYMESADLSADPLRPVAKYELPALLKQRRSEGQRIFPVRLKKMKDFKPPIWLRGVDLEPKDKSVEEHCDEDGSDRAEEFKELARRIGKRMDDLSSPQTWRTDARKQMKLPGYEEALEEAGESAK